MKSEKRGFTLIELLVVIAIIGLLASIVLASLNSARQKSRDARRIADMKQIQNALELYANENSGNYPASTSATAAAGVDFVNASVAGLEGTFIPAIPADPLDTAATTVHYKYRVNAATNATIYCISTDDFEGTGAAIPTPASTCNASVAITGAEYSVGN